MCLSAPDRNRFCRLTRSHSFSRALQLFSQLFFSFPLLIRLWLFDSRYIFELCNVNKFKLKLRIDLFFSDAFVVVFCKPKQRRRIRANKKRQRMESCRRIDGAPMTVEIYCLSRLSLGRDKKGIRCLKRHLLIVLTESERNHLSEQHWKEKKTEPNRSRALRQLSGITTKRERQTAKSAKEWRIKSHHIPIRECAPIISRKYFHGWLIPLFFPVVASSARSLFSSSLACVSSWPYLVTFQRPKRFPVKF